MHRSTSWLAWSVARVARKSRKSSSAWERSFPCSSSAALSRGSSWAGRDGLIEHAAIALDRIRAGRAARGLILHGLRGVGVPYFLQEWGRHAWNAADASPVSRADARRATTLAVAELDSGFSGSGLIDSLPRRNAICVQWRNSVLDLTALEISRSGLRRV
jgi:hypothetical protein